MVDDYFGKIMYLRFAHNAFTVVNDIVYLFTDV